MSSPESGALPASRGIAGAPYTGFASASMGVAPYKGMAVPPESLVSPPPVGAALDDDEHAGRTASDPVPRVPNATSAARVSRAPGPLGRGLERNASANGAPQKGHAASLTRA